MSLVVVIYGPLSQVESANLTDIQLAIVAIESEVREDPVHSSAVAGAAGNMTFVNALGGYWNVSGAPGEIRVPVDKSVGKDIISWKVHIRDTGSVVMAQLRKAVPGGVAVNIGSNAISAGNTTDQTLAHTLVTPETVVADTFYWVELSMPANNMRFYGAGLTWANTL